LKRERKRERERKDGKIGSSYGSARRDRKIVGEREREREREEREREVERERER